MDLIASLFFLLIVVAIGVGVFGIFAYNQLQQLGQEIKEAASNVQVAISRKLTLVNQLVDIVKGYQEAEQFTYLKIAQDTTSANLAAAYQQSGNMVASLVAVAERFPSLKASEQYHRLVDSIQTTEQDIQKKRQQYNAQVKTYNAFLLSFPTVLIAASLGFSAAPYLEFDVSGLSDVTSLKEFKTADGERLRELLTKGGEQLGKVGREMANHASVAGRMLTDRVSSQPAPPPGNNVAPPAPCNGVGSHQPMPIDTTVSCFILGVTGLPEGPMSLSDVNDRLLRGVVTRDTLCVKVGDQAWKPVWEQLA